MLRGIVCAGFISLALTGVAAAQKYPGTGIPRGPAPPPRPPAVQAPPPAVPAAPAASTGHDAGAERIARGLPLDPAVRDLQNQLPANVPAVERTLGLHPPTGRATDMRGRLPSPREIVDALAPR